MMAFNELINALIINGIDLSETQKEQLGSYYSLLKKYNKVIHLTSRSDTDRSLVKNFFDVIILDKFLPTFNVLVDLGAGPGFVGIIMKILRPALEVFLVERNTRKSSFLELSIKELDLDKMHVFSGDWNNLLVNADVAVSKASCGLEDLLKLMPQFLKENGLLLHYSSNLSSCINPDKFYQYYSPFAKSPSYICVFFNKSGDTKDVPRGTSSFDILNP